MLRSTRLILALLAASTPASALAAPDQILYRFTPPPNGVRPQGPVITDAAGNLYGTTYTGSASGFGTVYRLSPNPHRKSWNETVLFHFKAQSEGQYPQSALIFDSAGNLYGTTPAGNQDGGGMAYELSPPSNGGDPWKQTILYRFRGKSDGGQPYAGLTFGPDGSLYGTTAYGGANSSGTVFKLTPNTSAPSGWAESVLYSFSNQADGGYPYAGVVFDKAGTLYGTTLNGGNKGNGVVFSLTPSGGSNWTETVLHSFDAPHDGVMPREGLTIDSAGNLFGTTEVGGKNDWGVAYEVSPPASGSGPWTEQVIYTFNADNGAGGPSFTTLLHGKGGTLYGTTYHPGEGTSNGSVFSLTPPAAGATTWTHTFLHRFHGGTDGLTPEAGLIFSNDGKLTGTTFFGGSSGEQGVVFQITP